MWRLKLKLDYCAYKSTRKNSFLKIGIRSKFLDEFAKISHEDSNGCGKMYWDFTGYFLLHPAQGSLLDHRLDPVRTPRTEWLNHGTQRALEEKKSCLKNNNLAPRTFSYLTVTQTTYSPTACALEIYMVHTTIISVAHCCLHFIDRHITASNPTDTAPLTTIMTTNHRG